MFLCNYFVLLYSNKMNMKKIIFLLLALVALTGQAQVQSTTALLGTWSGKLNVGPASLTLVLHLEQADGYVVITLDSPDQGAKGIGTFKEFLSDDSLAIKVEQIGMTYRAKLKDGKLDGTFSQNGVKIPLVLTRGDVAEVKRPQNPQPPFPYETEEVTFRNEKDGATLAGTLTYPVDYDKQSKNSIATLRYDDRATGKSTGGDVKNATSEDFTRDALAGMEFLRQQNKFSKVGVLGHSEGGLIAFMFGAKKQTDFIVSLAGPGVKGDTLLTAQNNRIMSLSGLPATMTVEKCRQQQDVQEMPWLRWFIDYDPTSNIRSTRCPVFALNGDLDCQVIASQNLTAIRQLLPKSKKNLVKEYPGLNHLFQHCTTGIPTEYGEIEETISPEVLQDIASWIKGL